MLKQFPYVGLSIRNLSFVDVVCDRWSIFEYWDVLRYRFGCRYLTFWTFEKNEDAWNCRSSKTGFLVSPLFSTRNYSTVLGSSARSMSGNFVFWNSMMVVRLLVPRDFQNRPACCQRGYSRICYDFHSSDYGRKQNVRYLSGSSPCELRERSHIAIEWLYECDFCWQSLIFSNTITVRPSPSHSTTTCTCWDQFLSTG